MRTVTIIREDTGQTLQVPAPAGRTEPSTWSLPICTGPSPTRCGSRCAADAHPRHDLPRP